MANGRVSSGQELSGAWNFRDVAEHTGIAPGRFFRASELSKLDEAGRSALTAYGVTDVADLRTLRELERHGAGLVPPGVDIPHQSQATTTMPVSLAKDAT